MRKKISNFFKGCKRPTVKDNFFINHYGSGFDVNQHFSTEEQAAINHYYSIIYHHFDGSELRDSKTQQTSVDVNVILRLIFKQITQKAFALARELVISKKYASSEINQKIINLCAQRIATEPSINFPSTKFCNELDQIDTSRNQLYLIVAKLVEFFLLTADSID